MRSDSTRAGAFAADRAFKPGAREVRDADKTVTLRAQRGIEMRSGKSHARGCDQRRKVHDGDLRWRRKEAPEGRRER